VKRLYFFTQESIPDTCSVAVPRPLTGRKCNKALPLDHHAQCDDRTTFSEDHSVVLNYVRGQY